MSADSSVRILTTSSDNIRYVQKYLRKNNIPISTFSLSEDRVVKIVIKGIPTGISEEVNNSKLTNFHIKTVKLFGNSTRPLPICLIILTKDSKATETYDLTCCNCEEGHTANYRRCPFYLHVRDTAPQKQSIYTQSKTSTDISESKNSFSFIPHKNTKKSYANDVKKSAQTEKVNENNVKTTDILTLLTNLLTALASETDYKTIMVMTIKSFISFLSPKNA